MPKKRGKNGAEVQIDKPLNPTEVSRYLQISKSTVYRLLSSGAIPGTKVGHSWRVKKEVLDEYLFQSSPASRSQSNSEETQRK